MIWLLLIAFQMKHLIADYFLQTEWMLQKAMRRHWFLPLLSHSAIHGIGTLLICVVVRPEASWLAILDCGLHLVIDRCKALYSREKLGLEKKFWWALGIDQSLHHLTHYLCIWILMKGLS